MRAVDDKLLIKSSMIGTVGLRIERTFWMREMRPIS